MRLNLMVLYLILISFYSHAQSTIRGKVVSAETGEALARATVYLSNTTLGTITDENGQFTLKNAPVPPFNLNVSYVGFQTQVVYISGTDANTLTIRMQPAVRILDEVVVRANDQLWATYGAKFLEDFIGYSEFAQEVELQNPEDLMLYFDEEQQLLSAYSVNPLLIVNQALGYEISYWLESYEYSYQTKQVFYEGYPFFKDLAKKEKSKRKLKKWSKNRETAYNGSLTHFLKTLYQNDLRTQGFQVDLMERIPVSQYYENKVTETDTLYYNNGAIEKVYSLIKDKMPNAQFANLFLEKFKGWYKNPTPDPYRVTLSHLKDGKPVTEAFEFEIDELNPEKIVTKRYPVNLEIEKQAQNGKIAVIARQNINAYDSLEHLDQRQKVLHFENFWHITYLREKEEKAYHGNSIRFEAYERKNQTSIISIRVPKGLILFENGYFTPPSGLLIEGYWSFEKLDKLLPLDFLPEE